MSPLLGTLCRSGFAIEDVVEPLHARDDAEKGSFAHRSRYVAGESEAHSVIERRRSAADVTTVWAGGTNRWQICVKTRGLHPNGWNAGFRLSENGSQDTL
jgi:hypothetical protein